MQQDTFVKMCMAFVAIALLALFVAVESGRRSRVERRCVERGGNPGECYALAWGR